MSGYNAFIAKIINPLVCLLGISFPMAFGEVEQKVITYIDQDKDHMPCLSALLSQKRLFFIKGKMMAERMGLVEQKVGEMQTGMKEMRTEMKEIRSDIKSVLELLKTK
jgi:hypothetical protein